METWQPPVAGKTKGLAACSSQAASPFWLLAHFALRSFARPFGRQRRSLFPFRSLRALPLCAAGDIGHFNALRLQLVADAVGLGKVLRLFRLCALADHRLHRLVRRTVLSDHGKRARTLRSRLCLLLPLGFGLLEQVELAEKIARVSGIPDARVFFTNSGSEANEAALLMATYCGAQAQGRSRECGMLKEGMDADLVLVDFTAPHLMPCHNVLTGLVYAAKGGDVAMTMVRGKILYQNGKFPTIDLNAVVEELTTYAIPKLFEKEDTNVG